MQVDTLSTLHNAMISACRSIEEILLLYDFSSKLRQLLFAADSAYQENRSYWDYTNLFATFSFIIVMVQGGDTAGTDDFALKKHILDIMEVTLSE